MVFGKVVPCSSSDIRQVLVSLKLGGLLLMVFGKAVPCSSGDSRAVPNQLEAGWVVVDGVWQGGAL